MSTQNLTAKAEADINASKTDVWDAFANPDTIKKYMFGTTVATDWKEGSKITWKGEWKDKPYEDKGTILKVKPGSLLQYTHFSPLTGQEDSPENYHTVTIELAEKGDKTHVALSQDKNATEEEKEHSRKNWEMVLDSLKKLLENKN